MSTDEPLLGVLQLAKDAGVIGNTDLELELQRARVFVSALPNTGGGIRLLDIGSGGGLPGLVIAYDRPDIDITLIDRREKRTDLLQRQALRLRRFQSGNPIEVLFADVSSLHGQRQFDVVTARSFGSPETVLEMALPLLVDGGTLLVSEPPGGNGERWLPALPNIVTASIRVFKDETTNVVSISL